VASGPRFKADIFAPVKVGVVVAGSVLATIVTAKPLQAGRSEFIPPIAEKRVGVATRTTDTIPILANAELHFASHPSAHF
jgi:hypothetical protein